MENLEIVRLAEIQNNLFAVKGLEIEKFLWDLREEIGKLHDEQNRAISSPKIWF